MIWMCVPAPLIQDSSTGGACMVHTFSLYDGIVPLILEKLYDLIWLGAGVSTHLQADVNCSTRTVSLIHEKIYDLTWLDNLNVGTSPLLLIQMLIVPPGCILHTFYQINRLKRPFNFRENLCFGMVDWALWVGFRFRLFSGRCWLFHRAASSTLLLSSLMRLSL